MRDFSVGLSRKEHILTRLLRLRQPSPAAVMPPRTHGRAIPRASCARGGLELPVPGFGGPSSHARPRERVLSIHHEGLQRSENRIGIRLLARDRLAASAHTQPPEATPSIVSFDIHRGLRDWAPR